MSQGNIVATLLLVCQGFQVVSLRSLFVSHTGKDAGFCGNSSLPCRSIRFAVNISNTGDVLLIDYAQGQPYTECEYSSSRSQSPIVINKALSFIGIKGKPVIQCRPSRDLFTITGYTSNKTRIAFGNLIISKTYLAIRHSKTNFELTLERCVLSEVDIGIYMKKETHCSIRIFNSSFEDQKIWGIYTKCFNLQVHLTFVSFALSPVFLNTIYDQQKHGASNKKTEIFISNCDFNGKRQRSMCAELLRISPFPVLVNITINSSRFANHNGECQAKASITGALFISDTFIYRGRVASLITLNKLQVENNYSPLSAVHLISGPDFINTSTPYGFKVEILNSVFRNNTGSLVVGMRTSVRPRRITFYGPSILLSNNTFLENNYFKGGAEREISPGIKFINGRCRVVSCRFRDNIPGDLPNLAVVSIPDFAVVKFKNCYYENTQLSGSSAQIYAMPNSILQFEGSNTFDMITLKTNQVTFIHMPSATKGTGKSGKVILKGNLRIKCPPGFRMSTKSQFQITRSQRAWTYLYSLCEQCPPKTYSLARGELRDNITYKIQCHVCPRGGQCERGQVMAKPNFWGYNKNGKVSFLACPPKYCCDTKNCKAYDGCRGNRTGILCGQCPEGWSEPLFNAKCKLNEKCTSFAFWPGVLITLILYLMFFLYQKEIAIFVRKSLSPKLRFRLERLETSSDNGHTSSEQIRPQNSEIRQPKGSGLLKIIFYYYQIVHLFKNCVNSRGKQNFLVLKLEEIFSRAMNLIVINVSSFDCPFQNLRAVQKAAFLHSKGYCLLAFLGLVFLFTKCLNVIKRFRNVKVPNQCTAITSFETTNNTKKATSLFSIRIISAFTRISLVMYASSTQLCLSLLHCVTVGDTSVLFIDGTIKCYQTFQYLLLAYVVLSILPFCLVPVLGSYLLMFNSISVSQFCVACVFPLPFCCYWIYLLKKSHFRQYTSIEVDTTEGIDSVACPSRIAVLAVLSGPFRSHKPFLCFPASSLPWEGFLIFRRLILIVVLTFIQDSRLRLIVALIICVAILILHMYVKPFISAWQNLLETLSLGILIILCGFTLVQALYLGEDFSSSDSSHLLNVLDMVESILIISPLAIIIFLVMLSLFLRLIFALRFCIYIFVRRLRCCCK